MFYACVERYDSGGAAFAYVSEEVPPERNFCAGRYTTHEEAEAAAFEFRKLLKAGKDARDNAEFDKDLARRLNKIPIKE